MDPNDPSIPARVQDVAADAGVAAEGSDARPEGDQAPEAPGAGDAVIDEVADDPPSEDAPEDAPLTDVEGIGERLAMNLRDFGVKSAAALADMQTDEDAERLTQVAGIRNAKHARSLVEHAQTLLGWETVDED